MERSSYRLLTGISDNARESDKIISVASSTMLRGQRFSQVMKTSNFELKTNVLRNANNIFLDLMAIIRKKQIVKKWRFILRGNFKTVW